MAESQTANGPQTSEFAPPQINLPKGGGAIRGIGEKFTANAVTGTGALSVPIAVSPGRSGFGPQLSLAYDSGAGNGVFGIGWDLSLPSITRKTDKGLPRYRDREESDVFILSGAEDLVPVLKRDGTGTWVAEAFERDGHIVKRYRPRVEGAFALIERWTRLDDGDAHWRSISKDNVLTVYGGDANSRIHDPADHRHVFSWLICQSFDDKGNAIVYEYAAENGAGVDPSQANERRRVRTANRYPKRIRYGNRKPLLLDPDKPSFRASHIAFQGLEHADWMFDVVFDYGDEDYRQDPADAEGRVFVATAGTTPGPRSWPVRDDPYSSYRSTFEVRCYRLCRRVLMFHRFPEELGTPRCLVRSTEFEYRQKRIGSFLTRVTQSGYRRLAGERYLKKALPSLDFFYSTSPLETRSLDHFEIAELDSESLADLPEGIDGANYRWTDLDGEGISGVLTEQEDAWLYKSNLGKGRLGVAQLVRPKPSISDLSGGQQQLLDVAGDGNQDLVVLDDDAPGFHERTLSQGWEGFRAFRSLPVMDWKDPNLRFVDLTGDGIADILVTEETAFTWHASLLEEGFGPAVRIPAAQDENRGPRVVFADESQSIYLADMSGDGLSDIVRIRNGEICYWPNLGYGRFGPKVTMDNAPWFEPDDLFDQSRIKLADTDGSGTTDILYVSSDGVRIFLNQAGNSWSDVRPLRHFPPGNDLDSISVVDLLGRGTACLVWSSPLPSDAPRRVRYLDLMCGRKPHLLDKVQNNLGAATVIEYASSTEFYLADKAAGRPWITRLAFPVQVVKRVETYDYVSRNRFVTSYAYHHGYFDAVEREFRGFGMVEQLDTEEIGALTRGGTFPAGDNVRAESNLPPALTKTWFHTGVFLGGGRVSRHMEREYYRESGLDDRQREAMLLDDTILPDDLTPEEAREACRSLKGSMLRQEIYALDGTEASGRPYTVAESNFTIRTLQPRNRNRHGVFFTHARETVAFNYERKLYDIDGVRRADPRVSHGLTLEVDSYGDILKSADVGYGRRFADPSDALSPEDRAKQKQLLVIFTENRYTNAVSAPDAHRTPLLAQSRTYELIKLRPGRGRFGTTTLFRFDEMEKGIAQASEKGRELPYEDVDASGAIGDFPYRRPITRTCSVYRSNRLDRLLADGRLESLALPGENYKLAFTPGLLTQVYRRAAPDDRPPENLLPDPAAVLHGEGGYLDIHGDGCWWIRSGRVFYSSRDNDRPDDELKQACGHFFLPRRFHDPFGNVSTVAYDHHDFLPVEARDPLGNTAHAAIDYRVLTPRLVTDANGNRSEVAYDALGMVAGTAVMGKEGERLGDSLEGFVADLSESTILAHIEHPLRQPHEILGKATTRLVHDLYAFQRSRNDPQPQPAVVYTLARETHDSDLSPNQSTKIQQAFSYSDGFGREIQKKMQAEPGPLIEDGPPVKPRWVGSGWLIYNNKGKPVRQYEPFFSRTQEFEFASKVGVSPILFYDTLGRVVATLRPDHTYEKVVFDPWRHESWDVNDTVLEAKPERDPEVGALFLKLPASDYLPTWYEQRASGALGKEEQVAAQKAAVHANTPALSYLDSLGRTFLSVAQNRFERDGDFIAERIDTRSVLDIEGNQRAIIDALGRAAMTYDYDMLGTSIHQDSIDAGARWMLNDVIAKPLRSWDSRDHAFRRTYDALRRPVDFFVRKGLRQEQLAERVVYGEGQPGDLARNLRTRIFRQFDEAGTVTSALYDFKGNLLKTSRQLLRHYREEVDWSGSPATETEVFASGTTYDALNRPVTLTTPDSSVIRPTYNDANLIEKIDVNLRGSTDATRFVADIDYNARGQRNFIEYGNGARTRYRYDPKTFRLRHLETTRRNGSPRLQDLHFTYDPIGNITSVRDAAQEAIYFKNQAVSASNEYVYDAIYRLIGAEGRELIGLLERPQTTYDDAPRMRQPLPGDGQAMRRYRESYHYDAVGNVLRMIHSAMDGNWTRQYVYDERHPRPANNRLTSTRIGKINEIYAYDADGNMTRMPHLPHMEWDFKDQLHATQQQVVTEGAGERTYYVYDSAGQRVRKITERQNGSKKDQRIYVGGFELYHQYAGDGAIKSETETLHVMDDKRRIALVETRTVKAGARPDSPAAALIRYQIGNQLESSILELDQAAAIISYEEYYPYGSTSYQADRGAAEVSRKRYRYTGRERDEQTGLYYHGARYFAPWLGRWTSCDPAGPRESSSLYVYVRNNPVRKVDPSGYQGGDSQDIGLQIMWDRMGQEISGMIESVFGGKAYVNPTANVVEYSGPEGGVGGLIGGVVRAGTLRLVPIEDNPTLASLTGMEAGASTVVVLDPAERLVAGTTVTGQDTSRAWAALQLGLDVLPFALEVHAASVEARGLSMETRGLSLLSEEGEEARLLSQPSMVEGEIGTTPSEAEPTQVGGSDPNVPRSEYSGPWVDEAGDVTRGGAVSQSCEGSCVSAVGEMLTEGRVTERELLGELGEWSNPEALADELNRRAAASEWTGGGFGSEEDAVRAAQKGPMGAVVRVPGSAGHMVMIEPMGGGQFIVRDPLPGVSYPVDEAWIRKFVSEGVFRP